MHPCEAGVVNGSPFRFTFYYVIHISMLCCASESTPLTRPSERVKALVLIYRFQLYTNMQRAIMVFPGYLPSPYWSPYWINTQHPTCQWSLRTIPATHEINALREVFWQRVGKFLLKSIIALWPVTHWWNIYQVQSFGKIRYLELIQDKSGGGSPGTIWWKLQLKIAFLYQTPFAALKQKFTLRQIKYSTHLIFYQTIRSHEYWKLWKLNSR